MKFLDHDKFLHFGAGFLISWLAGIACLYLGWPLLVSFWLVLAAGLAKEIRDEIVYGGADFWDFAATAFGGMAANMILLIIKSWS